MRAAVDARREIIVGTRGRDQHLREIRNAVKESGLLYSANFSIGMNIFFRILKRAAELMNRAPEDDPYVQEIHHRQKVDSPSGTALSLVRILIREIDREKENLETANNGKISPEMLH